MKPAKGAALVEAVLFLPIFLAIIFGIIAFFVFFNSYFSFQSAVANAPKLAVTRGNSNLVGGEIIGVINEYWSDMAFTNPDKFKDIFCHLRNADDCLSEQDQLICNALSVGTVSSLNCNNEAGGYDGWSCNFYSSSTCGNDVKEYFPPTYAYTVAYVFLAMRQSIGESVYYPCDPDNPQDGAGCLTCWFNQPQLTCQSSDCSKTALLDKIDITCRYKPDIFILSTALRLLGSLTGNPSWGVFEYRASL